MFKASLEVSKSNQIKGQLPMCTFLRLQGLWDYFEGNLKRKVG